MGKKPMGAASWDGYKCAYWVATQDGAGPSWHAHFGHCNENAQCEAEGQGDCKGGIDAYYAEGPGGGHYDIIMGDYCYMAWGFCSGCSPIGTFMTHNFCPCKADIGQNATTKRVGRPMLANITSAQKASTLDVCGKPCTNDIQCGYPCAVCNRDPDDRTCIN